MKRRLFSVLVLLFTLTLFLHAGSATVLARTPIMHGTAATDNYPPILLKTSSPVTPTGSFLSGMQVISQNVRFVDHIGGNIKAVAVQGNYAYVGEGPSLSILDVSAPSFPSVVGSTPPLPGIVQRIMVVGGYVYIADNLGGLRIVDVSNPEIPHEVGFYEMPGTAQAVAVAGDAAARYAYVANGNGTFRIIDVTNPATPSERGSCITGPADGVAVADSGVYRYAYVAASNGGLRIIDVTNPAAPAEAGHFDCYAADVVVADSGTQRYAYVADSWHTSLTIIDVTDPASPSQVGSCPTGSARGVVLGGDAVQRFAYVAAYDSGLHIIDVTDPAAPTEAGSYDTPGEADGVAVGEGGAQRYAYIADYNGLRIIDVTNPAVPDETSFYGPPGSVDGIAVAEDNAQRYAYAAAYQNGLHLVDATVPTALTPVGFHSTPAEATDVAVALGPGGDYAYVADGWQYGALRIIDVAVPSAPNEAGSYGSLAIDVKVVEDGAQRYAYAGTQAGLDIVDVSNPSAPVGAGFCPTSDHASGAAIAESGTQRYAYIAAWTSGLRIFDVTNPASPIESGSYNTPGQAYGVALADSGAYRYAYVADWGGGLRIIDVTNPAAPFSVGYYSTPYEAQDVAVAGDSTQRYAYVADREGGLGIINVTDPSTPILAGFFDTAGTAVDAAVAGSYVYVADLQGGLVLLWFAPPTTVTVFIGGGVLTSPLDSTDYTFPAGAFAGTTTVVHTPIYPGDVTDLASLVSIGHVFEITATDSGGQPIQPAQPYSITVRYTNAEQGSSVESSLALYYWSGAQWVREPTSVVDADNNTITAHPHHFSRWAALGKQPGIIYPVGPRLGRDGRPFEARGMNFYPKDYGWEHFWMSYTLALTQTTTELDLARDLGVNTVRIFLPYGLFDGSPQSAPYLDYLQDFIGQLQERDMVAIVTLFDQYTSDSPTPYAPGDYPACTQHISAVVGALGPTNPTVMAWDIKNEPDRDYEDYGQDVVQDWLMAMISATRGLDLDHMVTIGFFGAVSNVYSPAIPAEFAPFVDFVSMHYALPEGSYLGDLQALEALIGDKPVLLEEFGLPTFLPHTETGQAAYYNALLALSEAENIAGTLFWTLDDFSYILPGMPESERCMGILRNSLVDICEVTTTVDYTEKPAAEVVRRHYAPHIAYLDLFNGWVDPNTDQPPPGWEDNWQEGGALMRDYNPAQLLWSHDPGKVALAKFVTNTVSITGTGMSPVLKDIETDRFPIVAGQVYSYSVRDPDNGTDCTLFVGVQEASQTTRLLTIPHTTALPYTFTVDLRQPPLSWTGTHTFRIALELEPVSPANGYSAAYELDWIALYAANQADFAASPTSGKVPLAVAFTDHSIGDYTATTWFFGDGATSTLRNPTHTYGLAGTYTVTLTIQGPSGADTLVRPGHISAYELWSVYLPIVLRNHH